jgi:outer membrane protein insertion porin family
MHHVHTCLLAFAVLAGAATARAAVNDYLGKPVVSVRVSTEGRETTDVALLQVIETRVGRPLATAEVRESLTRLFSLGRFEDVRVDASMSGGGVSLVYELSPIHPVTKITFAGTLDAPGVDVGQLRRAVVDRYGTSPPLGRTADLTRTIADALRQRGYLHADIQSRAERRHAPDRATLFFRIDPGPRTEIGTIEIVGTPAVPRAELLNQLGLALGGPYEADALNARIEKYVESRRSRGFYETKVVPAITLDNNDRTANVTLTVSPGAHARVVFTGDSLPADKRTELVPIEREGSVDEDLLEDASKRIEDYLHAGGYRDATAAHTREQVNGELVVTFKVHNGPQYRVSRVEISGNTLATIEELRPGLRVRNGQAFSSADLDADEAGIEGFYHRRGFATAKAGSAVDVESSAATATQVPVIVRIVIREGVRTLVGSVRLQGNTAVSEAALRKVLALQPGAPYFQARLRDDVDRLVQAYDDLGYRTATVGAVPNFTRDGAQANPVFTIREGPRLLVDQVLIVGNVRTSAEVIERELQLKPGDPLSQSAKIESQRRLAALGLFRRTQISELVHGDETRRDLLVSVEEALPTTVIFGAGFDVLSRPVASQPNGVASQKLEFAPLASFDIGRRNLFGKNRSVDLFTNVSPHTDAQGQAFGFPEYRVSGTFREPRVLNTGADAFLTGTLTQQIRSSFNFAQRGVSAQIVRKVTPAVSVSGSYQLQRTQVFDLVDPSQANLVDRVFPKVRLSSISFSAAHDTRDDVADPSTGHELAVTGWMFAQAIGSQIGFTKTLMTAEGFRKVPHTTRMVVASRVLVGLAHPFPQSGVDIDLPASERFFAGGPTTVRGYALDALGGPYTLDTAGFALGGDGLVVFNLELRAPVWKALEGAVFFDAGNVFQHASDIDLTELRGAVGFGLRYKSPVGPLRIDLGFKLHRDVIPANPLTGAPAVREGLTALHISLGQAF